MSATDIEATTSAPTTQRRVMASFKRHVNLGNYDHAELFMMVEDYVPLDCPPEQAVGVLRELASTIKATVIDELGLEFEITDGGVVLEVLRQQFGPTTAIEAASTPAPQAVASSPRVDTNVSPTPPHTGDIDWRTPVGKAQQKENRQWAAELYASTPPEQRDRLFYDNQLSKRSENHPDFKHKASGTTFYKADAEKAGVVFPS